MTKIKKVDQYMNVQAVEIQAAVRKLRSYADAGDKVKADETYSKALALLNRYYRQQMIKNGLQHNIFCYNLIVPPEKD